MQRFEEAGDSQYIYQNKLLDKACFQHDVAYVDVKDITGKTASDKVLRDRAFSIVKNMKSDGYQRGLASVVYNCF